MSPELILGMAVINRSTNRSMQEAYYCYRSGATAAVEGVVDTIFFSQGHVRLQGSLVLEV